MNVATLGPEGTNSELAAKWYIAQRGLRADVILTATPEDSVRCIVEGQADVAIACAVYPRLNHLVFDNLGKVTISDCFRFSTDEMVLARSPSAAGLTTVLSHPAPRTLIEGNGYDIRESTSNSAAARACAAGESDGCITTRNAADSNGLVIVRSFGAIPMGWVVLARQ